MNSAFIIFPHHLFEAVNALNNENVFIVEESLFFTQYKFHKQKLVFHRASMKCYEEYLIKNNITVNYIETKDDLSDIRKLIKHLVAQKIKFFKMFDPCDEWLRSRIDLIVKENSLELVVLESPQFINSEKDLSEYLKSKSKYFQSDFYIRQRKRLKILIEENGSPKNGKWSFDAENRLKYPSSKKPPLVKKTTITKFHQEAISYVESNFPDNYGEIDKNYCYPISFDSALESLHDFFKNRFHDFGIYEDAIVSNESHLHHSVITPMLNIGLLTPTKVIDQAIQYANENNIPYNSLEGFVRQIIGWREYIRVIYIMSGNKQRTTNFWQFKRKIPESFYQGKTDIEPIDQTILKLKKSAYNHHIERLMVISNFMLLCEFNPNEVYKWFMEMYIDAYDWVMVPNVYGMAQFADGGLMSTKPYISSSNYIFKMSDYKRGKPWAEIWDALFWRFMHVHRKFFVKNPRMGMLLKTYDKWDEEKKQTSLSIANNFLASLDKK